MKRVFVLTFCAALLVSSCGTYTGSGAYTGSYLGSILGSAIGGISDGYRGSNIGTVVGMAGGAIVGGAIGAAADAKDKQEVRDRYQQLQERKAQDQARQQSYNYDTDDSGFDGTNSGDDIIYDFNGSDYTGNYSAQQPTVTMPASSSMEELASNYAYSPSIEIRNARFVDDNQDNVISRGELCKVIFEVVNNSSKVLYDVQPTVVEANGNKHLYISPSLHVEQLDPGCAIRYTAMVKADNRLKEGNAKICLSVVQGNRAISKVSEFNIPTRK